jgi:uncharacterized membrane protein YfcA
VRRHQGAVRLNRRHPSVCGGGIRHHARQAAGADDLIDPLIVAIIGDPLIVAIVLGAAVGGFVQGLAGSFFSLTAMAIWAWIVDPQLAAPLSVVCSLAGQLATIRSARAGFSFRRVLPFVIGGAIGVPLGTLVVPYLDQTYFRLGLGVFLAIWCPFMLFDYLLPRVEGEQRVADGAFGMAGGIMGGLGGLAGAMPTLWSLQRGWDKDARRSVVQSFNLSMHVLTVTAYLASGLITPKELPWFALAIPAMLVPALLGARLYQRISDAQFRRIVLIMLFGSGIALLASALPKLLA